MHLWKDNRCTVYCKTLSIAFLTAVNSCKSQPQVRVQNAEREGVLKMPYPVTKSEFKDLTLCQSALLS